MRQAAILAGYTNIAAEAIRHVLLVRLLMPTVHILLIAMDGVLLTIFILRGRLHSASGAEMALFRVHLRKRVMIATLFQVMAVVPLVKLKEELLYFVRMVVQQMTRPAVSLVGMEVLQ